MRVLFFIEPVIFRSEPDHLAAHLPWARYIESSVTQHGGAFALVSNPDVCAAWLRQQPEAGPDRICFGIDPIDPLVPFGYRRDLYAAALYEVGDVENPLQAALSDVCDGFRPDLVVMSSQNAIARSVFKGLPVLSIERAPLPRHGHPLRMCFDLFGHQTLSLLETRSSDIQHLQLADSDLTRLDDLGWSLQQQLRCDPRYEVAVTELSRIRENGPIALLATQPPDWVTYDGSLQRIPLEELLCLWEEQLPPGWIGVPTYHAAYRLDPRLEIAIARSRSRIQFLSPAIAQGMTEVLLPLADGVVSISSTVSMTGLLFGKRVVVTGRSPFNAWCSRNVAEISAAAPLSARKAASTLAFLTHRYAWLEESMEADPDQFFAVAKAAQSDPKGEWFFDFTDWSPERAVSHFNV